MKLPQLLVVAVCYDAVAGFQPLSSSVATRRDTALSGWLEDMLKPSAAHGKDTRKVQQLDKKISKLKPDGWLESLFNGPIHGSGSATEQDLDEMFQAQQELLHNRKIHGQDKDHLKKKYFHKTVEAQEQERHQYNVKWEKMHKNDPLLKNKAEDEAMYVDDDSSKPVLPDFKMPWQNIKLKP